MNLVDEISKSIQFIEDELGLSKDFNEKLLDENDWSFVIKTSTLLEAVATSVLISKFNEYDLEKFISSLSYASLTSGKIKLLLDTRAIEKSQFQTLLEFATLRNKIVHDVKNVNFNFNDYILSLEDKEKEKFVDYFSVCYDEKIKFKNISASKKDFTLENPKISIWFTIREIVACMSLEKELDDSIVKVFKK